MRRVILSLLLSAVLLTGMAQAALQAQGSPVHTTGSGVLGPEYYIPTTGTPVSGNDQGVFDGENFFIAETTAERKLMGYWVSPSGEQLRKNVEIADMSESTGNLSQPSVCILNGTIYVAWVETEDENDNYSGGAQYISKVTSDGGSGKPVCICREGVWPRRPGMAAGYDGILLIYRVLDEDYWSYSCYAVYVDENLGFNEPYRINEEPFAVYPTVAYACQTGRFLVVWEYNGITGAVVTKNTASTPENFSIMKTDLGSMEKPWAASDGRSFLVSAHNTYYDTYSPTMENPSGIWTASVDEYGHVGEQRRTIPLENSASINNGQLIWNGSHWLLSCSYEREWQGSVYLAGQLPDFRFVDSYLYCLDPQTGDVRGHQIGIATGWWHQFHPRLVQGKNGKLLCTYLEDDGSTRLCWCMLEGEFSESKKADAVGSGLKAERIVDNGLWRLYGGDSDGETAYAAGPELGVYKDGMWTFSVNAGVADKTFGFTASDGTLYVSGWGGLSCKLVRGSAPEEDRFEDLCGYGAYGNAIGCGIWAQDADTVWIAACKGSIWSYRTGAESMTKRYEIGSAGYDFHDIHGSSGNDIFAVGDRGLLVHYDGRSWKPIKTPVCLCLNSVRADGSGGAWIVGDGGTVLRYEDGECSVVCSPVSCALYDIWCQDTELFYVCGGNDTVLIYDHGTWSSIDIDRSSPNTEGHSDTDINELGALAHIFGVEENGNSLRLFIICESEEYGMYTVTVPLPAPPLLKAKITDGQVVYSLGYEVPWGARVFAARYDGDRMTGSAEGRDGTISPPGQGTRVRVFLVDRNYVPFCEPITISVRTT